MKTNINSVIDECTKETTQEDTQAMISAVCAQQQGQVNWLMSVSADPKLPNSFCPPDINCYTSINLDLLREAQNRDPSISYKRLARKLTAEDRQGESPQVKSFMHEWSKLYLEWNNLLYRKTGAKTQLVLPKIYHCLVYKHFHDDMGHLGAERELNWLAIGFTGLTWPGTSNIILVVYVSV